VDRVLTKQELEDWKASPVGKAIRAYLLKSQEALKSQWAMGRFSNDDAHLTQAANTGALEKYQAYDELINLDYEQYSEVMEDDDREQKRLETTGSGSAV
jgi:hypothetical protein